MIPISVVSVVMGHLSTRTTKQHYVRVKYAVAVKEVAKTFERLEEAPKEYEDSQMPKGFESVRVAPQESPKAVRDSKKPLRNTLTIP